jgi:DNA transformation protein
MAARSSYVEFVTELLSPLGRITTRSMFGGYCLYCNGIVFALIANDTLYLKADEHNRGDLEAAGAKPFRPFAGQTVTMQYYEAPAGLFESVDGLNRWGRSAVEAGQRAQRRPRGRARSVRAAG